MKYGVSNARKVECKKHSQLHPEDERCPLCPPPSWRSVSEDIQPEDNDTDDYLWNLYNCFTVTLGQKPVYDQLLDEFTIAGRAIAGQRLRRILVDRGDP